MEAVSVASADWSEMGRSSTGQATQTSENSPEDMNSKTEKLQTSSKDELEEIAKRMNQGKKELSDGWGGVLIKPTLHRSEEPMMRIGPPIV